jgi:steroid Delta-isomerase
MADPEDVTAAIRATVERYWATFSASDRDGWLGCFAADAWIEDPVGTPRREGVEDIGAFFDQSHGAADSIELRGGLLTVCGTEAAFTMEVRPTIGGTTFVMDVIDAMTFAVDGGEARITTMKAFWDPAAMRVGEA